MSKFFILSIALIVLAVACGKPINDKAEAHDEPIKHPHDMSCRDAGKGYDRCENSEVICYEMNTRIWCFRK